MKNVKFFLLAAFIAIAAATLPVPAWSDTTSAVPATAPNTLQEPATITTADQCVVNPSAIATPVIHPTKKTRPFACNACDQGPVQSIGPLADPPPIKPAGSH